MGLTFILAAVLLAVLLLGCLASILLHDKGAQLPGSDRIAPLLVAACTVPVAAFVFYLAHGYTMLAEILPVDVVCGIYVGLQVIAPLAAGAVCIGYYLKNGRRLRFFLLFWMNLVLAAVGTGAWAISKMA